MATGIWGSPQEIQRFEHIKRDRELHRKIKQLKNQLDSIKHTFYEDINKAEKKLNSLQKQIRKLDEERLALPSFIDEQELLPFCTELPSPRTELESPCSKFAGPLELDDTSVLSYIETEKGENESTKNCEKLARKKRLLSVKVIGAATVIAGSLSWLIFKK